MICADAIISLARRTAGKIGSIAQLGEHLPYKQRVRGSSPLVPTKEDGAPHGAPSSLMGPSSATRTSRICAVSAQILNSRRPKKPPSSVKAGRDLRGSTACGASSPLVPTKKRRPRHKRGRPFLVGPSSATRTSRICAVSAQILNSRHSKKLSFPKKQGGNWEVVPLAARRALFSDLFVTPCGWRARFDENCAFPNLSDHAISRTDRRRVVG